MSTINRQNTDKFQTVFSNIPVPTTRTTKVDMAVFDRYVKSVTLPDYNLELVNSDFRNIVQKQPASRFNSDLSPLTIEFILDEDLENYITFFDWINELRLGNPTQDNSQLNQSVISRFSVIMKDNQNRSGVKIEFCDLFLISLSSLNLIFGNSEQVIFNCTFQYSIWDMTRGTSILNN